VIGGFGKPKIDRSYGQCQYRKPFSWLNDNATILVKNASQNRAALLDAKKIYQLVRLFRMLMVPNLKTERI
jgi:hypothetical protein